MDADRIKGVAQEAGGKLQQGLGQLTGDDSMRAEGLVREAGGRVQSAFGTVQDRVRETVDDIGDMASDAAHHGGDYARQGAEYAKRGANGLERTMRDYPIVFLLAAAGFGFVAATLLNDQSRNSTYRR